MATPNSNPGTDSRKTSEPKSLAPAPIGGFLGLENNLNGSDELHMNALPVSCGRAALRLILQHLQPGRIWLPFYNCDAVVKTVAELCVPYSFYHLNDKLQPVAPLDLKQDEWALVINYFGIQANVTRDFCARWGRRAIVDNTQAFFEGAPEGSFTFNSARKFFGVPDGSYLFSSEPMETALPENTAASILHLQKRSNGDLDGAYKAFQSYERSLTSEPARMSAYSRDVLGRVDYEAVRQRRRRNYEMYHAALAAQNTFACELEPRAVPFCYPFVPPVELERKRLHERGIFVPMFWPEVNEGTVNGFQFEKGFARRLLPLPLDQRYGPEEVQAVINEIRAEPRRA